MPKADGSFRDPRKIFVVHGRDLSVRDQLLKFLKHIDTVPISWAEARNATGKPSPTTLEIVSAGLAMAQAIVVLFTPDDRAKLNTQFLQPDDGPEEREYTGQARQNVLLEAGMALGLAPERTVMVRFGRPRRISDIDGLNWITLSDKYDDRRSLVDAIANAGVQLDDRKDFLDFKEAGRFSDDSVWWDISWKNDGLARIVNRGTATARKVRLDFDLHDVGHSWSFDEMKPYEGVVINSCEAHGGKGRVGKDIRVSWTSADGIPSRAVVQMPSVA